MRSGGETPAAASREVGDRSSQVKDENKDKDYKQALDNRISARNLTQRALDNRYTPPVEGPAHVNRLLDGTFNKRTFMPESPIFVKPETDSPASKAGLKQGWPR